MAKVIEYDVTDVEESSGGTGVKIKPGVHPARIVRANHRTEKKNGEPANDIELALDVGEQYDWVFTYVGLSDASDWKLAELVRAVGLKDKGKLDLDKHVKDKVIRVKINSGTYEGEYSPDAGRLMKAQPGDEDIIGQQVSEISSNGDGPVGDEPAASGKEYPNGYEPWREGEEDDEGATIGSYDDWSDGDLEGEVNDRGLTIPGGRGSKKNKYIAALRADDSEALNEPEEAEASATDDAPADDYDEWDLDKLKQEWTDRNMGDLPAIRGRGAADRMKTAIIEELRKDDVENPFDA